MRFLGHTELVRRLCGYGLSRKSAINAVHGFTRVLKDILLEGKPVNMHEFGSFHFGYRKARVVNGKLQAESRPLKFVPSEKFRQTLKLITPSEPQRRKKTKPFKFK